MKAYRKHIIVTGGGNGIGRELCLQLLIKGAKVTAIDNHEQALQETQRLAGIRKSRLYAIVADITLRRKVEELSSDIVAQHGPVDGLINNAGIIQPFVSIRQLDYEHIERVMDVNFFGTVYMVKSFLPHLSQRPEAHIVNISSMGGFIPVPGQTIYGASKAAVKLFTEGLQAELSGSNIQVTLVMPGAIDTDISRNSGVKMPSIPQTGKGAIPMLPVSTAAMLILEAMEKNTPRLLVGKDARNMFLLHRLHPSAAARLIQKKMGSLLKLQAPEKKWTIQHASNI